MSPITGKTGSPPAPSSAAVDRGTSSSSFQGFSSPAPTKRNPPRSIVRRDMPRIVGRRVWYRFRQLDSSPAFIRNECRSIVSNNARFRSSNPSASSSFTCPLADPGSKTSGWLDSATSRKPPPPVAASGHSATGSRRPAATAVIRNAAEAIMATESTLRDRCLAAFRNPSRVSAPSPRPPRLPTRPRPSTTDSTDSEETSSEIPSTKKTTMRIESPENASRDSRLSGTTTPHNSPAAAMPIEIPSTRRLRPTVEA